MCGLFLLGGIMDHWEIYLVLGIMTLFALAGAFEFLKVAIADM